MNDSQPKKRKSSLERAWSVFRRMVEGKADCVVVFRLTAQEDGSWHTEWAARHWLPDVPPRKLPPGVPGAIMLSITTDTAAHSLGGTAGSAAGKFLQGLGEKIVGEIRGERRT